MSKVACALVAVAIVLSRAHADMPANQVYVQTVQPTQSYPEVPANGEGWFDVGGFCKVVDVGNLSAMNSAAIGVPVFVPGPTDQWENYRRSAASGYNGELVLTTCCRPQENIATLCAAAANPQPVSRQYGKLGEVDSVSATCISLAGQTYTETMSFTCGPAAGEDLATASGPNGQGSWSETTDRGAPQCPATTITWHDWSTGLACTGALPATPVTAGQDGYGATTAQAVQIASAADGYVSGSTSDICVISPGGAPVWADSYNSRGVGSPSELPTCRANYCPSSVTWSVGSYTCTGNTSTQLLPGQNGTAYTVQADLQNNGPTTIGGSASVTCGSDYTLRLDPGATCGPGQCVAEPGVSTQTCVSDCYLRQYDSCGAVTGISQCGSCAACAPTAGSCSCSTHTDSCGNGCTPTDCGGTTTQPSGGGTGTTCAPVSCPAAGTLIGGCKCEATAPVTGDMVCTADHTVASCATLYNYCSAIFAGGPSADGCSCLPNYAHAASYCIAPDDGYSGGSTCCADGVGKCNGCTPLK